MEFGIFGRGRSGLWRIVLVFGGVLVGLELVSGSDISSWINDWLYEQSGSSRSSSTGTVGSDSEWESRVTGIMESAAYQKDPNHVLKATKVLTFEIDSQCRNTLNDPRNSGGNLTIDLTLKMAEVQRALRHFYNTGNRIADPHPFDCVTIIGNVRDKHKAIVETFKEVMTVFEYFYTSKSLILDWIMIYPTDSGQYPTLAPRSRLFEAKLETITFISTTERLIRMVIQQYEFIKPVNIALMDGALINEPDVVATIANPRWAGLLELILEKPSLLGPINGLSLALEDAIRECLDFNQTRGPIPAFNLDALLKYQTLMAFEIFVPSLATMPTIKDIVAGFECFFDNSCCRIAIFSLDLLNKHMTKMLKWTTWWYRFQRPRRLVFVFHSKHTVLSFKEYRTLLTWAYISFPNLLNLSIVNGEISPGDYAKASQVVLVGYEPVQKVKDTSHYLRREKELGPTRSNDSQCNSQIRIKFVPYTGLETFSSPDQCNLINITPSNHRVLTRVALDINPKLAARVVGLILSLDIILAIQLMGLQAQAFLGLAGMFPAYSIMEYLDRISNYFGPTSKWDLCGTRVTICHHCALSSSDRGDSTSPVGHTIPSILLPCGGILCYKCLKSTGFQHCPHCNLVLDQSSERPFVVYMLRLDQSSNCSRPVPIVRSFIGSPTIAVQMQLDDLHPNSHFYHCQRCLLDRGDGPLKYCPSTIDYPVDMICEVGSYLCQKEAQRDSSDKGDLELTSLARAIAKNPMFRSVTRTYKPAKEQQRDNVHKRAQPVEPNKNRTSNPNEATLYVFGMILLCYLFRLAYCYIIE
ncbi:hypothetical protein NEHOM01_1018 [Nematocida homosporus]|uniref:uncharacterized protein n=1 Tax=Nematocida homosporus TaxID=1912981 RepID=UPI00221E7D24|nr:uncharacterized protein NEHOM01_1018 [Nematocida homosporus]KAI5185726.1 hypothetical protein NEHOM01_1018 [Nematocida homosporus]